MRLSWTGRTATSSSARSEVWHEKKEEEKKEVRGSRLLEQSYSGQLLYTTITVFRSFIVQCNAGLNLTLSDEWAGYYSTNELN